MFTDTEKAFDNISWTFMTELLEKMNCGETFLKAIEVIYYSNQYAMLIVLLKFSVKTLFTKGDKIRLPLVTVIVYIGFRGSG